MSPPPMPEDQRDTEQLRLLAVFHYVLAGLGIIGLLFLLGHHMVMKTVFSVFDEMPREVIEAKVEPTPLGETPPITVPEDSPAGPEPEVVPTETASPRPVSEFSPKAVESLVGGLAIFYLIVAFCILAMMILNLLSAVKMRKRKGRIFSMVVAGLNCMSFPLGTALGVFTFVVLSRPSVESAYRKSANS